MMYEEFRTWLKSCKGFSTRSSNDVLSRLKRVMILVGVETVDSNTSSLLENSNQFANCSLSVKSQLRRAIILYNEYNEFSINKVSND